MFGPLKKKKTDAPKVDGSKGVDFGKVKTGGAAKTNNAIVSPNVLKSGNMSSMGLTKEEQAALIEKRNQIPVLTKALKYSSIVAFAVTLAGFLFFTADLEKSNAYFSLVGLNENTGSAYARISQENTQKKTDLEKIQGQIAKLQDRIKNGIFGNFVDTTQEITGNQRHWYTDVEEVEVTDEETGEISTKEQVRYGYLDMINYLVEYFEDRNFKTTYFKEKEEGLVSSGSRSRGRISSSEALLMDNEVNVKTIAVSQNSANLTLQASDIYGKIFTLGSEFVEVTNSTPIFKAGGVRSFQRQDLQAGDAGLNMGLRLELQTDEDEDPADEKFKYLHEWLVAENLIPDVK